MKGDYSVIDYSMQCGSLDVGVFVPAACSFAASSVVPAPVVAAFPFLSCGLGVGCVGGPPGGAFVGSRIFFAHVAASNEGPFLTAWAVLPLSSCSCSYAYGRGTAVGPQSGKRCWTLLACGGLSLP